MNRDLVINVLLIIAGIVLAIALFGAGVWWRSSAPGTSRPLSLVWLVFRGEAGRQCLRLENLELSPNADALCRCTEKDRGGAEGACEGGKQDGLSGNFRIARHPAPTDEKRCAHLPTCLWRDQCNPCNR